MLHLLVARETKAFAHSGANATDLRILLPRWRRPAWHSLVTGYSQLEKRRQRRTRSRCRDAPRLFV